MDDLKTSIEYIKGIGPNRAKLMREELNINYYEDLLTFFPFRHIDRSKFYKISEMIARSVCFFFKFHIFVRMVNHLTT